MVNRNLKLNMQKMNHSVIKKNIEKIQQQKVLVIGDLMLDEFVWGKVSRISPEAPVPVVHVTHDSAYPGGAANVARNLSDFGISVCVGGLIGRDSKGKKLCKLLHAAGISTQGVLAVSDYSTIVKTRIIARHQQVVRVDREIKHELKSRELRKLLSVLEQTMHKVNAVILEDYGKGFITQELVQEVVSLTKENRVLVTVDPNINNSIHWSGVTMVKPNRHEAYAAAGMQYAEDDQSLIDVGNRLLEKWEIPYLLITLGEEGMILFHPPEDPYHTPTKAREVYDVSGAGDTAIAFFTAAMTAGLPGAEAAEIANHAAGIVVGKLGTATLTPEELFKSFSQNG